MLKQLLEKANRKCEMRWRAYAYDPEKDNELIKTSDAFDCIDCAMQFKRDYLEKHCNHIVQIVAESKRVKNEAKEYKVGDTIKVDFNWRGTNPRHSQCKIVNKRKAMAGKGDSNPGYEYLVKSTDGKQQWVNQNAIVSESTQKNEEYKVGDRVRVMSKSTFGYGNTGIIRAIDGDKFTIDFNAPNFGTIKLSAKDITKESSQKNEEYKVGDLVEFRGKKGIIKSIFNGDVDKTNKPMKYLNVKFIDGQTEGHPAKYFKLVKESSQKNEEYKAGQLVGDKFTKDYVTILRIVKPNKEYAVEYPNGSRSILTKEELDSFKESAQKNESLNLDSLTDEDAKQLIVHLQDFIKDKSSKYYHIDKIEAILKKKYKAESVKNEDLDDDSTGIIKNDDEKQMTEARGWRVSIKLQSKDNMNNINVEDAIEDALNGAGFTVNDVDAVRM